MNTNYREEILVTQNNITYDADASPKAFEHYKKVYIDDFWGEYKIANPEYRTYTPEYILYTYKDEKDKAKTDQRLVAVSSRKDDYGEKKKKINNKTYYSAGLRLSGECDFNFKEGTKYKKFLSTINNDNALTTEKKKEIIKTLDKCKKMHHTSLNFSLMQVMGNMQCFKGTVCEDRLDKFVYYLSEYYNIPMEERNVNMTQKLSEKSDIIKYASNPNKEYLITYLNAFDGIYDYCKKVYFIEDHLLVDKIIRNSSLEINTGENVNTYMKLANKFWDAKKSYFRKISNKK